jgi:hypothetical protein
MQPEEAGDKENDNDDADDVENIHVVLRLRHTRFQHESAALQQGTFLPASRFRRPGRLFGDEVVNFIQSDTVNGRTIRRITKSHVLYARRFAGD